MVVQRGQWEVCDDANFHGNCVALCAGQYPSLRSLGINNRISSARPIKGKAKHAYAPPPPPAQPYAYSRRYGETLYQANVAPDRRAA